MPLPFGFAGNQSIGNTLAALGQSQPPPTMSSDPRGFAQRIGQGLMQPGFLDMMRQRQMNRPLMGPGSITPGQIGQAVGQYAGQPRPGPGFHEALIQAGGQAMPNLPSQPWYPGSGGIAPGGEGGAAPGQFPQQQPHQPYEAPEPGDPQGSGRPWYGGGGGVPPGLPVFDNWGAGSGGLMPAQNQGGYGNRGQSGPQANFGPPGVESAYARFAQGYRPPSQSPLTGYRIPPGVMY